MYRREAVLYGQSYGQETTMVVSHRKLHCNIKIQHVCIFVVGVSTMRCSWLAFVVATSTSSFDLFLGHSILMVNVCKPVLLEIFLQSMFFQWLLDLIVSSKFFFLRSSKPRMAIAFAGVSFLITFDVFFAFYVVLCQVVLFCTTNYFYTNQIRDTLLLFFLKKNTTYPTQKYIVAILEKYAIGF